MIYIQMEGPEKKDYNRKSGAFSFFEKSFFIVFGIVIVLSITIFFYRGVFSGVF